MSIPLIKAAIGLVVLVALCFWCLKQITKGARKRPGSRGVLAQAKAVEQRLFIQLNAEAIGFIVTLVFTGYAFVINNILFETSGLIAAGLFMIAIVDTAWLYVRARNLVDKIWKRSAKTTPS